MEFQTIKINSHYDLIDLIIKNNLSVKEVNLILDSFLIQKAFFVFEDYTCEQIATYLKEYFNKYSNVDCKPIFIEPLDFNVKDFILKKNSLIKIND